MDYVVEYHTKPAPYSRETPREGKIIITVAEDIYSARRKARAILRKRFKGMKLIIGLPYEFRSLADRSEA